jgi:hypothetical protein
MDHRREPIADNKVFPEVGLIDLIPRRDKLRVQQIGGGDEKNTVTAHQESQVTKSVAPVIPFLLTAGAVGAGAEAATIALDNMLLKTLPIRSGAFRRSDAMMRWETFSPAHAAVRTQSEALRSAQRTLEQAEKGLRARPSFDAAWPWKVEYYYDTRHLDPRGELPFLSKEIEATVQQSRTKFLGDTCSMSTRSVKGILGTPAEVAAGKALFVRGSYVGEALLFRGRYCELGNAYTAAERARRGAVVAYHRAAESAVRGVPAGAAFGFAKGTGVAALSLGVGYTIDSMLGNEPTFSAPKLFIDGVIVPSIAISRLPQRLKIPVGIVAFAGARALDYLTQQAPSLNTTTETLSESMLTEKIQNKSHNAMETNIRLGPSDRIPAYAGVFFIDKTGKGTSLSKDISELGQELEKKR